MQQDVREIDEKVRRESGVIERITGEIEKVIVGQRYLLERLLVGLFADGHILLEGVPGLAKTLSVKTLAQSIAIGFQRIQFTPDLLPGDITGGYVFDREQNHFVLREGPVFANIILADEINRASPKTQSALLEAMQEYQVTLEGETMALPQPFIVLATQNPIEYEGTFPLPEAQLDRFIMKLGVGYPTPDEEQEILRRRRSRGQDAVNLARVTNADELGAMRAAVEEVYIEPDLERYIIDLVDATRHRRQVAVGASPRGSLALFKTAQARAAIDGRDYVTPDDVKALAQVTLAHRLIVHPAARIKNVEARSIIAEVLASVPVPGARVRASLRTPRSARRRCGFDRRERMLPER